jgi:hypothetical protein
VERSVLVPTNRCLWVLAIALAAGPTAAAPASSAHRAAGANAFVVRGLVSDGYLAGSTVDSNLVNAWGLAASASGPWWIANEATDTSTRVRWNGAFVDRTIPAWYNEFGIQAIGGRIFVTYASPAPVNGNDSPTGGYVDVFDLKGKLLARVGRMGPLNEPVDVALAPPTFGKFGGDLLVGNFGDGRIGVYHERGGNRWGYRGALRTPDQRIIEVSGLWGLEFGNGASAGRKEALYFTAGPHTWHGESEEGVRGLFGTITPEGQPLVSPSTAPRGEGNS